MANLVNQKFGKLTVIGQAGKTKDNRSLWLCLCRCHKEVIVRGNDLQSGNTKSCGCLKRDLIIQRSTIHGHSCRKSESPTYMSWRAMFQRCKNPNCSEYKNYGHRGIDICQRWEKFENFLADMGERPTTGHSLDRINNDQGYWKTNCKWATAKEQARNTRQNHLLSFEGRTQCVLDWAEEINLNPKTLYTRLARGWPTDRALTVRVEPRTKDDKE